jgi:N-acetyl-D-muramate 6-phosphate phosphatase
MEISAGTPWPAAVVFDLDDTLWRQNVNVDALNAMLKEDYRIEAEITMRELHPFLNQGAEVQLQQTIGKYVAIHEMDAAVKKFRKRLSMAKVQPERDLFQNVVSMLESLKHHDIPIGMSTNTPHWLAEPFTIDLGIRHYFDAVIGSDKVEGIMETVPRKPSPVSTLLVLDLIRRKRGKPIPADRVVYVGDDRKDCEAARAAGIGAFVLIRHPEGRPYDGLPPAALIENLGHLMDVLAQLSIRLPAQGDRASLSA